ncbi:L-fucose:H+ symporter permease [Carboxylicivirga sediminis]|uniref:L-fucose:H+ symporter permease n=1 Tax=Carboxylicivirga sediminis TaxID=2006564 RepID=A0A941IXK3_9BACT|nr:L-fucose:H+ symporter permease [Carboxylicivirga sediminis]MBR8536881.1 L-fucose:H+ symporter permease [Carboxylicivirga sediminis]
MSSLTAKVVEKKYIFPFILLTSLFFLWGIANDLTNPMVSAFKKVMPELSNMEAALVQLAFYGGYATMAIPASLFIRKYSYKSGILVGLALYATGAFLFIPAAKFEVFGFFLASLYILTFGLAFLETTSNPYVLSMGAAATATRRLNLAQTFNPLGSLLGIFGAQILVLKALRSDDFSTDAYSALPVAEQATIRSNDLAIISTPYVILGFIVLTILVLIAIVKMPDKTDRDKQTIGQTYKLLFSNRRYYEGVIAQMFYVGAQIMCWTFIYQYVDNLNESRIPENQLTATWYNMAAMVAFFVGRSAGTFLLKYIKPALLMLVFAIAGIGFTLGAIFIQGLAGLISLVGISITMSIMFPTIYGLALKGMGDEAKLASAGLVMAIVGGALLPPLQGLILDIGGPGFNDVLLIGVPEVNFSYILPLICLCIVAIYSYRAAYVYK